MGSKTLRTLRTILCLTMMLAVAFALSTTSWAETYGDSEEDVASYGAEKQDTTDMGSLPSDSDNLNDTDEGLKSDDTDKSRKVVAEESVNGQDTTDENAPSSQSTADESVDVDATASTESTDDTSDSSADIADESLVALADSTIELESEVKHEMSQALASGESVTASFSIDENCYVAFAIDAGSYSNADVALTKTGSTTVIDEWTIASDTNYRGMLPLHPGSYTLTITSTWKATVITGIEYKAEVPQQSLTHLEEEPNNSRENANALEFNNTVVGTLCSGYVSNLYTYHGIDWDYYSFTLKERKKLSVTMSTLNKSGWFGFNLKDSSGKTVISTATESYATWGTSMLDGTIVDFTTPTKIDCGDLEPGTYYIEVTGYCSAQPALMGSNHYQFIAALSKPTPIVDTTCALLRSDNSAWTCSSEGEPIRKMKSGELNAVKKLFIEANVKSISRDVFYESKNSYICDAFKNLKTLEFLTNAKGINACTVIEESAFQDCKSLSKIVALEKTSLTLLGDYSFRWCSQLSTVSLPKTLKTIGWASFSGCTLLEKVEGLQSTAVIEIQGCAFYHCTSLTSITVPKTLKTFGNSTFEGCTLLKSINGLSTCALSTISSDAFMDCTSLTSLTFPKTLASMEGCVFAGCNSLKKVVLPSNSVIKFMIHGEYTFEDSLFSVDSNNGAWIYVPYGLLNSYKKVDPSYADLTWTKHLKAISVPPSLAKATISVSDQAYTGSAIKPTPTVKLNGTTLKQGTDYTVSYKNNTNVGTATVTVTGKGSRYSGSASKTFNIYYWSGASKIPVRATAGYSCLKGGYMRVKVNGKYVKSNSIISVNSWTITGLKPGKTTLYLFDKYGNLIKSKTIEVYSIHGKTYEMESAVNSKFVLDIQGASTANGARMIVYTRKSGGNYNQRYQFYLQSDNTYAIRSVKSKKWLDVQRGSMDNSAAVLQWSWTGGKNQKWRVTVDAKNRVTFVNAKSGKCFDVQGGKTVNKAKMIQYTSNNGLNQKWVLRQK